MPNAWFRMYGEFATDPKVRTMPESLQLRLVRLFCLRCSGPTEKLSADEIKFGLDCADDETFRETFRAFQAKGFIDENWAILNWNSRQFTSDSSTGRVKKYREKQALKQSETFLKRRETQNETDQNRTEQNRTEQKKTSAFALADWVPPAVWMAFELHRKAKRSPMTDHAKDLIVRELDKLRRQGHDPGEVLNQSIRRGWLDVFEVKSNGQRTIFGSQSRTAGNFDEARAALELMAGQDPGGVGDGAAGECIEGHISTVRQ